MRRRIGVISPRGESEPASNGGRRVNVGVVLAQIAMLLLLPFPAWPQATAFGFDQPEPGRPDEYQSDLGIQDGAENIADGLGNICHYRGGHCAFWCDQHSRSAAHGSRTSMSRRSTPTPGPSARADLTDDSVTNSWSWLTAGMCTRRLSAASCGTHWICHSRTLNGLK